MIDTLGCFSPHNFPSFLILRIMITTNFIITKEMMALHFLYALIWIIIIYSSKVVFTTYKKYIFLILSMFLITIESFYVLSYVVDNVGCPVFHESWHVCQIEVQYYALCKPILWCCCGIQYMNKLDFVIAHTTHCIQSLLRRCYDFHRE